MLDSKIEIRVKKRMDRPGGKESKERGNCERKGHRTAVWKKKKRKENVGGREVVIHLYYCPESTKRVSPSYHPS
jgi:hypothetical protein